MGLVAGQTCGNGLLVGGGELALLAEATLALGGLLGQDVALESLAAHDLARAGAAETLLGAAVGLHLRHEILLLGYYYTMSVAIR